MATERKQLLELVTDITENPTTPEKDADYLYANGVRIPVRCEQCQKYDGYFCRNSPSVRAHKKGDDYCSDGKLRGDDTPTAETGWLPTLAI